MLTPLTNLQLLVYPSSSLRVKKRSRTPAFISPSFIKVDVQQFSAAAGRHIVLKETCTYGEVTGQADQSVTRAANNLTTAQLDFRIHPESRFTVILYT